MASAPEQVPELEPEYETTDELEHAEPEVDSESAPLLGHPGDVLQKEGDSIFHNLYTGEKKPPGVGSLFFPGVSS